VVMSSIATASKIMALIVLAALTRPIEPARVVAQGRPAMASPAAHSRLSGADTRFEGIRALAEADDEEGIHGATAREVASIRRALRRFDEAGLDLAPIMIEVQRGVAGCEGNRGLYVRGSGIDRIQLCDVTMPIILHELAHAWEAGSMRDEVRLAFLERLGLTTWSSPDVPWSERGAEQAAMTISFGLAERPLDAFGASVHADSLAAYELLTGRPSPRLPNDS
jgi:hypothetical protein